MNVLLFERKTAVFKTPLYNTILLTLAIYYSRKLSPHSGGCMNPTIAIGMNLAVALVEKRDDILRNDLWVFIVGPMTGSLIVYIIYYGVV
jgi:glycerol uptake facilitator-like aquaporin